MDQFNQFDNLDPFFSPPQPSPPPTDASNALALPPLATYPSKEALFEAIQSWSRPRGYAFTIGKSTRRRPCLAKIISLDCTNNQDSDYFCQTRTRIIIITIIF